MKFDIGGVLLEFVNKFKFWLKTDNNRGILHENLHALLCIEVIGWGIFCLIWIPRESPASYAITWENPPNVNHHPTRHSAHTKVTNSRQLSCHWC
jgi:hypothetical protein